MVEGDLANVIGWLRKEVQGPWRLSHIVKEAYSFDRSLNSFYWIPRKANVAVDELVKQGVHQEVYYCEAALE